MSTVRRNPAPTTAARTGGGPVPESGDGSGAAAPLDFEDPFSGRSADDCDRGWGERSYSSGGDSAADLARFLDEKPPHHL